jgi:hypothetical protein
VRLLLLPFVPVVEPVSGVGIRADAPRKPRLLDGRGVGVVSRVSGCSFSLSEFIDADGLRTEKEEVRTLLSLRGASEGSR